MKHTIIKGITLIIGLLITSCTNAPDGQSPFSFEEVRNAGTGDNRGKRFTFTASDGKKLAACLFEPETPPEGVLLFFHGGGAYGEAGYQPLAAGISEAANTAVVLMDLRGHGYSEGKRGGTPRTSRVWMDMEEFARVLQVKYPGLPFFMGGHSSGAGVLLNMLDRKNIEEIRGVLFLSPYFGYKSNTDHPVQENPFAEARLPVFVLNGMTWGLFFGNTRAVDLNYPPEVLEARPLLLTSYSCNMSKALTPSNPQKQFAALDIPYALYIGSEDELFNPPAVIAYQHFSDPELLEECAVGILEGENHLSALTGAVDELARFIISRHEAP